MENWTSQQVNSFLHTLSLSYTPQLNITGSELACVDDNQLKELGFTSANDRNRVATEVFKQLGDGLDSIERNVQAMLQAPGGSGPRAVRSLRSRPTRSMHREELSDHEVKFRTRKEIRTLLAARGLTEGTL